MYQDQEEEDDEEGEDEEEEEDEEDDKEGEEEGNLETDEESSDDDALDGAAPTPKRRKFAQDKALEASLGSGLSILRSKEFTVQRKILIQKIMMHLNICAYFGQKACVS